MAGVSVRKARLPREKCGFHTAYVLCLTSYVLKLIIGMNLAGKAMPFRNGIGL